MRKEFINVQKTARYFILGEPNDKIDSVWIVAHGYGQLAEQFLQKFSVLVNDRTIVVAPEALNRFYVSGSDGKIGASWMTKEERITDINDYVFYFDAVLDKIKLMCNSSQLKINLLGFSQGAASIARWVGYGNVNPNRVIFWGGLFPPDMNWELTGNKWKNIKVDILIGDNDEYYTSAKFKEYYEPIVRNFKSSIITVYNGKHTIYPEILKNVL